MFRAETQDGGDAKVEVSPRDIIYTQSAEPLEGEEPEILHKLDLRYGYEKSSIPFELQDGANSSMLRNSYCWPS